MNINVTLPAWGTESWPSMSWNGYRMPVKTLLRQEDIGVVGTLTGAPSLSYNISGGADASQFELVNGKILAFIDAPDYEFPSNNDGNNVYGVEITITNGTDTVVQPFNITIGDDGMVDTVESLRLSLDEVGQDVGTLQGRLGDTTALNTTGAITAVQALNNIEGRLATLEVDPVTATTVSSLIQSAKTDIVGGATTAYDTLGKIQAIILGIDTRLTNAEQGINTLNTAVSSLNNDKASQADMLAAQSAITALQALVGTGGDIDARINDAVNAMRNSILNGAGAAVDTLKELADLVTGNADLITNLNTVAAGRVAFDTVQNLTTAQQGVALANIGAQPKAAFDALLVSLGDLTHDFKAGYIAKRDAAKAAVTAG